MKEETIICGDFNIDISDTYHQQYKNLINSFNYQLQNAEPTGVIKFTSLPRVSNPDTNFQRSLRSTL